MGAGLVGGRKVLEGARRPLLGVPGADLVEGVEMAPVLLRVLPTGRAGRAVVGGPLEGREALGSVAISMLHSYATMEERRGAEESRRSTREDSLEG